MLEILSYILSLPFSFVFDKNIAREVTAVALLPVIAFAFALEHTLYNSALNIKWLFLHLDFYIVF